MRTSYSQILPSTPYLQQSRTARDLSRYRSDPQGYARDVLKVRLTPDQEAILDSVRTNRRTACKASHAIGKTFCAAIAANWWYDCWEEHIVYITAPTWGQAMGLTFKQVKRFRLSLGLTGGEVLDSGIVRDPDRMRATAHFIKALNAGTGEGFQGEHSADILIIMEEAVGVPPYIWEASDGLMTSPGCVVPDTCVAGAEVRALSKRPYIGPIIEIETRNGWRVAVTPNHPILTEHGWVPAALLNEGDDLIGCHRPERVMSFLAPDDHQVPAVIEQITAAAVGERFLLPVSRNDFHGDGQEGEVDIIRTAGLLNDGLHAAFEEPFVEPFFLRRHARGALQGQRPATSLREAVPLSAHGSVREPGQGRPFFGGARFRQQPVRFFPASRFYPQALQGGDHASRSHAILAPQSRGRNAFEITGDQPFRLGRVPGTVEPRGRFPRSRFDAARFQKSSDGRVTHTQLGPELLRAFPGNVTTDQIVRVRRVPFCGHVYNLESDLGWYASNNIISHNCRLLAIANPTDEASLFGAACATSIYHVLTICALDHPNITAELAAAPPPFPGAVRLQWLREMLEKECEASDTGEGDCFPFYSLPDLDAALSGVAVPKQPALSYYRPTASFQGRVLGQFPTQADEQVIPRGWLAALPALERETTHGPEIGCDVARFGSDRTTLAVRQGPHVLSLRALRQLDNVQVTNALRQAAQEAAAAAGAEPKEIPIKIDVTGGLGTGPYDFLKAEGYRVVPVNAGAKPADQEQFLNRRSEMWWVMRERVRNKRLDLSALPKEVREPLIRELSTPKYKVDGGGRKVVEPKDQIKARLGESPDLADAVNMAFADLGRWWEDKELLAWLQAFGGNSKPDAKDGPKTSALPAWTRE